VNYEPSPLTSVREHVERYEATDGAEGYERRGYFCVILTHRGQRTGQLRKTPVMKVVHDGKYLLVGSFAGAEEDPIWVRNVLAEPRITIRDRYQVISVTARLITGEERAAVWASAVTAFPPYAEYQERTTRSLPLFLCHPNPSGADD
jgi:deazaflavin-dependent oxidoreductase (nitroreductase family)